ASHETAEAATDPDVNYGRLGWYDPQRGEIGDITENNPNALVRLDGYLVQLDADRNDQLLTLAPPVTTPPPGTTATTTTLTAGPGAVVVRGRSPLLASPEGATKPATHDGIPGPGCADFLVCAGASAAR